MVPSHTQLPTSTCEVPCRILVVAPLHLRKLGNLGSMGTEEPDPRRNKEDSHACRYLTMCYSLLIFTY